MNVWKSVNSDISESLYVVQILYILLYFNVFWPKYLRNNLICSCIIVYFIDYDEDIFLVVALWFIGLSGFLS